MIWASDEDWQKLAVDLVDRNNWELIEFDEIAEVNGRKVLGGLMVAAKAGYDRNTGPQRLIMNNWAQNVITGDMPQLPMSGQWRCLVLEDEETLVWSGRTSSAVSLCSRVRNHGEGG